MSGTSVSVTASDFSITEYEFRYEEYFLQNPCQIVIDTFENEDFDNYMVSTTALT